MSGQYGNPDAIDVMYQVMAYMSIQQYPIIFKGAMVLKLVAPDIGTARGTKDIDADWVDTTTTNEILHREISKAVGAVCGPSFTVKQKRQFSEGRSASFDVMKRDNITPFFSFDISVKDNKFYTPYNLINNIHINGASLDKIFADKLTVLSERTILRRPKDMYDLFLLSYRSGFRMDNIIHILNATGRSLGCFDEYKTHIEGTSGLKHSYNMMRSVTNKPDFALVYLRVANFVHPFLSGQANIAPYEWLVDARTKDGSWYPVQ